MVTVIGEYGVKTCVYQPPGPGMLFSRLKAHKGVVDQHPVGIVSLIAEYSISLLINLSCSGVNFLVKT